MPWRLGLVLGMFVLVLIAAYQLMIPALSSAVAERIPEAVTTAIGNQTLEALDRELFRPSALPEERQRQIAAAFDRLQPSGDGREYRLEFRGAPELGPNAMALPSGTIVVTDELVELSRDDREILGVLAHEAGHVEGRHGMRLVVQSSFLTLAIALLAGDLTVVAAAAPAALLQAKYSRDLEREADAHAADVLRSHGISPSTLADLLERLDAHAREASGVPAGTAALDYMSSHPATEERLEYLRSR